MYNTLTSLSLSELTLCIENTNVSGYKIFNFMINVKTLNWSNGINFVLIVISNQNKNGLAISVSVDKLHWIPWVVK